MVLDFFSSGTESCFLYFCVVLSWIFFSTSFMHYKCKMICVKTNMIKSQVNEDRL